jgi:uncharacterized integral membrane protein (TIGR00698 family)
MDIATAAVEVTRPLPPAPRVRIAGRHFVFLLSAALCLTPWATPPLALALGAVLALTLESPFSKIGHRISKGLLQACVVLLGFGMNLQAVLRAGAGGAVFAAGTITLTLLLGYAISKLLDISPRTSGLISVGTAICGGSAIAAVGSVLNAEEGEMTVAMGVVFLLNGAALYLFPVIGHALHLTNLQFGTWAGVAIHDVSSVVGAASQFGIDSLQTATAVKLSRALWIVPVTLGVAIYMNNNRRGGSAKSTSDAIAGGQLPQRKIQIPWFIGLFLLASICRTFVPRVATAAPTLSQVAKAGLTLTLFLVGTGMSRTRLRAVGWKALAQGIVLWLVISSVSLLVIMRMR